MCIQHPCTWLVVTLCHGGSLRCDLKALCISNREGRNVVINTNNTNKILLLHVTSIHCKKSSSETSNFQYNFIFSLIQNTCLQAIICDQVLYQNLSERLIIIDLINFHIWSLLMLLDCIMNIFTVVQIKKKACTTKCDNIQQFYFYNRNSWPINLYQNSWLKQRKLLT